MKAGSGVPSEEEVAGLMAPPEAVPSVGSLGRIGEEENAETSWRNFVCRASHPVAAFFHLAFKGAALGVYLFGAFFFGLEYVNTFVITVLLLAADFWTVKNVTGRLLVGLRWWVKIRDDGSNEWRFESAPATRVQSALDSRIFWTSVTLAPVVWGTFAALAFIRLSLDWFLIDAVAVGLTGANLIGFYRCSAAAKERLASMAAQGAARGLSMLPSAFPALGGRMLTAIGAGALSAVLASGAAAAAGAAAGGAAAAGSGAAAVGAGAAAPTLSAGAAAAGSSGRDGNAGVNPFANVPRGGPASAGGRSAAAGGAAASEAHNPFGDFDDDVGRQTI